MAEADFFRKKKKLSKHVCKHTILLYNKYPKAPDLKLFEGYIKPCGRQHAKCQRNYKEQHDGGGGARDNSGGGARDNGGGGACDNGGGRARDNGGGGAHDNGGGGAQRYKKCANG